MTAKDTRVPLSKARKRAHALEVHADTACMKHIRDAQKLLEQGHGHHALAVIENLLGLAPRNSEALRIKAQILDAWGRFDESLELMRQISVMNGLSDEAEQEIDRRAQEERESLIYSELTPEGRWYFAFPRLQIWVSLVGFLGCATFLLLSSHWLQHSADYFFEILAAFGVLVLLPWIALMCLHFLGIKKVLVGMEGLRVCTRFRERSLSWSDIGAAVVEYDLNTKNDYLKLVLYGGDKETAEPILCFDISAKKSVIRARRHFTRSILTYIDCVTYRCRALPQVTNGNEALPIQQPETPNPGSQAA